MVSSRGIIGRLFGEVLDRSGLKDSIASQCQRIACVLAKGEVPPPAPGTPLIVDLFGVLEHSGIYLGDGRVAELFGDNLLREVTLSEFLAAYPSLCASFSTSSKASPSFSMRVRM